MSLKHGAPKHGCNTTTDVSQVVSLPWQWLFISYSFKHFAEQGSSSAAAWQYWLLLCLQPLWVPDIPLRYCSPQHYTYFCSRSCIKTIFLLWIPQVYIERQAQSWDEISESRDFRSVYKQWAHPTNSSAVLHGAHWRPELLLSWAVGWVETRMLHFLTLHPGFISNGNGGIQTIGKKSPNMQIRYRPDVLWEGG